MSSTLKYALLIAIVLSLASIPLSMQREQVSIDGFVTNQDGPIAKASVEARNVMSGSVARAQSDAAGHYKLMSLPPGRYSLWVTAPAHDSVWIREVIVREGRTTRRDIRLGESGSSPLQSGSAE